MHVSLRLFLLFSFLMFTVNCGGGGSGESSAQLETWNAGTLTFRSNERTRTEEMVNFTIILDLPSRRIAAHADDEWWNWGPAACTLEGSRITAESIPETEGGDNVLLSLDLIRESDTQLSGRATIDYWIEDTNSYFNSFADLNARR